LGWLSAVPSLEDAIELPDRPDLKDPKGVEIWRNALVQMSCVNWQPGCAFTLSRYILENACIEQR
jgi:hypothetical protein